MADDGRGGGTEIGPILDPISVLPHACFHYPNEDVARKLDKDWVNYSIHDHPHTPNHRVDAPPQGIPGPRWAPGPQASDLSGPFHQESTPREVGGRGAEFGQMFDNIFDWPMHALVYQVQGEDQPGRCALQ